MKHASQQRDNSALISLNIDFISLNYSAPYKRNKSAWIEITCAIKAS